MLLSLEKIDVLKIILQCLGISVVSLGRQYTYSTFTTNWHLDTLTFEMYYLIAENSYQADHYPWPL